MRCTNKQTARKKPGRIVVNGYVLVKLQPDNFFFAMTNSRGYVFEHRLVMAKKLGRLLHSWEEPHHKNLDHADNRIENLELRMTGHGRGTANKDNLRNDIERLKVVNLALQTENAMLKQLLQRKNGHKDVVGVPIKA